MNILENTIPMRILVVEDNLDIAENIGDYFEEDGHILDFAMDGIGGLHMALTNDYDVIILDIMLPKLDGLTFCHKLRTEGGQSVPVIMLTARDTLDDKLDGFRSGADDYLVKPFALEELEVRVKALVKRTSDPIKPVLEVADLKLDTGSMQLWRSGKAIKLNRVCLKILTLMMQAYPNLIHRDEIELALWGDAPPGSDALRSHIYAIRRAIDKPFKYPLLQTIRGVGYRLVAPDEISL